MVNKRDTSKQRRAQSNRAQRAALDARTKAASAERPSRQAPTLAKGAAAGTDASAAPPRKGLFGGGGGARAPRPPRPGDVAVDIDTLEGNFLQKRLAVPGGRQVFMAFLLTIALDVVLVFQKIPTDPLLGEVFDLKESEKPPTVTNSIFEVLGAWAYVALLVPVLVVGLAFFLTLSPLRRKVWIGCAVLMGIVVIGGFGTHLFVVGFLSYAVWRAAKIEGPMRPPREPAQDA